MQSKLRLLQVQTQPRVQFILAKVYQLTFHSVVLPLRIKNVAKIMMASMKKPVGFLSLIISLECNRVPFEEAKLPLLNSFVSFFYKMVLTVRINMYSWTKVESSMPNLISRMSLPTGITKYIQQELIYYIKTAWLNVHTILLVITSVLSSPELILISSFGPIHFSTIFKLPMHLLLLSKTHLVYFRQL